ncbi:MULTISPECIES: hypothetical protein [unclassified Sulfitobacter]|uniref:hypothetical protein n=1 Tax=unclassified Sulfitobacter TaxID=196795 RepID=UPI0007C31EF8|nr:MULTISPECIES: hypothetical protein [unclassified Sulfitobacter]KZX94492.1 hypothetical protein A3720_04550 [Sulfitobacter sp. HI0021]KZY02150.1 hypothetical protein A3722_06410 [Sulfitobacter sp. HI0027]KZZ02578.1 hypothetical protein A3747_15175 [Sulfitobacter sp. HI0076]
MNEWGIPDWRSAAAYGRTDDWNQSRWFWEFLRRRDDLRREFEAKKDEEYERALDLWKWDNSASPDGVRTPDEPGFYVGTYLIHPNDPTYIEKLPNPKIAEHPYWATPKLLDRSLTTLNKSRIEFGERHHRIDFDLDRPLRPQLEAAERALKAVQEHRHGKTIQKRRHSQKWLTYLRAMDAREAKELGQENAPSGWPEIAEILPLVNSVEGARKAYQAGLDLSFNF